jgi:hypothetical protein
MISSKSLSWTAGSGEGFRVRCIPPRVQSTSSPPLLLSPVFHSNEVSLLKEK